MFSFENIHRNKKLAFTDGFLCGLVIAFIANGFRKDYLEMKELDRRIEEARKNKTTPEN